MSFAPAPLNVDPLYPNRLRATLRAIAKGDQERHDDQTFYDLVEKIADALHMGVVTFETHDELVNEVRDAHDKWLDIVDPAPSTWLPGDLNGGM